MKVLIKSDLYNINNRIKKFDSSYRVVYDNGLRRYQIYSTRLYGNIELIGWTPLTYVCTLPYEDLDARAIQYLYDTSVDNMENILNQIDENNRSVEVCVNQNIKQQSLTLAENKLRQLS